MTNSPGPLLTLPSGEFLADATGTGQSQILQDFLEQHKHSNMPTIQSEGASNNTFVHGQIDLRGHYPNVRGLSFFPVDDLKTLLRIDNPGIPFLDDLWFWTKSGQKAMTVNTTDVGVTGTPGWQAKNNILGAQAKLSVAPMTRLYFLGDGRGPEFANKVTVPQEGQTFTNHLRIWGCFINTKERSFNVSSGIHKFNHVQFEASHVNVETPGQGPAWDENSFITWYCPGFIEPGNFQGQLFSGPQDNLRYIGHWPIRQVI